MPYKGAVATPPEIRTFPVATPARAVSVVEPEAKIMSPTAYDAIPVPPRATASVPEVICEVSIAIAVFVTALTLPYASVVITGT